MSNLELYIDTDSFIHRIHPSVKLILLLLIFSTLILTPYLNMLVLINIFLFILFFICKVKSILVRFRLLIILIFIVTLIMWIITVQEGDVIFKIWILKITDKGFLKGLNSALRLTGMLFAGSLFIATTRLEEIGCGMEKLGIPGNFSFSLITAVRLIPLYLASLSQIIDAQTSRGHVIDTRGLLRRIKNYVPLLIPAFLSSIRNINHLSMALEVRGFSNRNKRTSFLEFKLSFIDYVALITISAVFLFTVYEVIIFYF